MLRHLAELVGGWDRLSPCAPLTLAQLVQGPVLTVSMQTRAGVLPADAFDNVQG